jgi:carboxylate-amine ligase
VHGLVAFARCLILRLADAPVSEIDDVLPVNLPIWMEHQNRFRAALRGLDAEFIIDEDGASRPIRGVIDDLIAFCSPIAADINETQGLGMARDLLKSRPGYQRQLDAHADEGTARSVAAMLQASMLGQSEYLYQ